jgi:nucleoid-associated protein YgaU
VQNLAIGLVLIGLAVLVAAVLVLYQFAPDLGLTAPTPLEADSAEEDSPVVELTLGGDAEEVNKAINEDAQQRMSLDHIRKVIEEQPAGLTSGERASMDERKRFQHVVRKGETLISLAREYLGDAALWQAILDANPALSRPEDLREGQTILIPMREAK